MSAQPNSSARIFHANTPFENLARRPGGLARERAIQNAADGIEKIKPEMVFWLKQGAFRLDRAIQDTWISSADASRFDTAIELSGSLRDVGATLGFPLLSFICGNLYEILSAQKEGASFRKDIIDCHRMALVLSIQDDYRMTKPEDLPVLKSGLLNVLSIFRRENGLSESGR